MQIDLCIVHDAENNAIGPEMQEWGRGNQWRGGGISVILSEIKWVFLNYFKRRIVSNK